MKKLVLIMIGVISTLALSWFIYLATTPPSPIRDQQLTSEQFLNNIKDNQQTSDLKSGFQETFVSAKFLYQECSKALNQPAFSRRSFCSAYLEGYLGGGSITSLYVLGHAENQRDMMKKFARNECNEFFESSRDLQASVRLKLVAEIIVNWMDDNSSRIPMSDSSLKGSAFMVVHKVLTDESYCLNSKYLKERTNALDD